MKPDIMQMNELKWLEKWHLENANNDGYALGIKIETLDNPGWIVKIDLSDTKYAGIRVDRAVYDNSEDDWMDCHIEDNVFIGVGDCMKLGEIISFFRERIIGE